MAPDAAPAHPAGPDAGRPGRPRDARAGAAILDATLELFVECGFEGMSIEGIAARAGVGKATIYRRWPSKEACVVAAVAALVRRDGPPVDTGDVVADLTHMAREARRWLIGTTAGEILPQVVAHVAAGTPLGRLYVDEVLRPKRRRIMDVLDRGIARGELREDLDTGLAADVFMGTMVFLRLNGRLFAMDDAAVDEVVDQAVAGMRPGAAATASLSRRARPRRRP
jgi:AcrR family transcriptional regulator